MLYWALCVSFILVLSSADVTKAQGSHWSYEDIENWPGQCQNGKQQSPIDIDTSRISKKFYPDFQGKNFNTYQTATIGNNGHTVNITFSKPEFITAYGGGLPAIKYQLDNIHFHWRSEHTVDNFRFPLEIHLVLFDAQYSNVQEAVQNKGVAVLGVLVESNPKCECYNCNSAWDVLERQLYQIREAGTTSQLRQKILVNNFLPYDTCRFFRYSGSLTTPDCNEGIIWTVFRDTICLPPRQINAIKQIRGEDGQILESTYRPVQPLNGRSVTYS